MNDSVKPDHVIIHYLNGESRVIIPFEDKRSYFMKNIRSSRDSTKYIQNCRLDTENITTTTTAYRTSAQVCECIKRPDIACNILTPFLFKVCAEISLSGAHLGVCTGGRRGTWICVVQNSDW